MVLAFLVLLVATTCLSSKVALDKLKFHSWKLQYNKSYANSEEETQRFVHFQSSIKVVERLSAARRDSQREDGAVFGLTQFADLSQEEFRAQYLMPRRTVKPRDRLKPLPDTDLEEKVLAVPQTWDWRKQGLVTAVKNQLQCGSCWAFSATETIESAYMMKHNITKDQMTILSEQQMVDCDPGDAGCGGGNPPVAYEYIMQCGGQEPEKDYPYTGQNGNCNFHQKEVFAKVSSWQYACGSYDEESLKKNTYTYGPSSICLDAANWQYYQSGVMSAWQCAWINQMDHCVQAVGWDLTVSYPYWQVRNSWGTTWGENGYIRLEYGANTCGLTGEATYVIAV